MGRRRGQQWGMPADRREPLTARISLGLVLMNVFVWIGFRNIDILVVSFGGLLFAVVGFVLAHRIGKRIRKYPGRMTGDQLAVLGYWGNALLMVLNGSLFCYLLAIALLRGELL